MAPLSVPNFCFVLITLVLCLQNVLAQGGIVGTSSCTRNIKNLAGTKCGVKGTVSKPALIRQWTAKAPYESTQQLNRDCMNTCLDAGRVCKSWSVNNQLLRCNTFSATIESMSFTADSAASSPLFYSRDCVDGECFTETETRLTTDGQTYDENNFQVCPPMPLRFYGVDYACVNMSVNGVLSFQGSANTYQNTALPNYTGLGPHAIAAFWDDLIVEPDFARYFPEHYLSWSFHYFGADREVVFTWKTKDLGPESDLTWVYFRVRFQQGSNRLIVEYPHMAGTSGESATIGIQNQPTNRYIQVTYNSALFLQKQQIVFDMTNNNYAISDCVNCSD